MGVSGFILRDNDNIQKEKFVEADSFCELKPASNQGTINHPESFVLCTESTFFKRAEGSSLGQAD